MPFQILALSGGGYRGLFSIDVLARMEQRAGRPIGQCFDLIAGTSIGGIVAIGLAMGKSAESIRTEFIQRGEEIFPPSLLPQFIGRYLNWCGSVFSAKYNGIALRHAIDAVIGPGKLLGDAQTRLLVPAVNMTTGRVQMFKTPHHERLTEDGRRQAADVAMATSAAPLFFPLAKVGDGFYADGGLVANAPDACAIHEAIHFCGQRTEDLRLISIGTTTTGFGLPTSLGVRFGAVNWIKNQRLLAAVFGAQQQIVDNMTAHVLGPNYLRIDAVPSFAQTADIGLDVANEERRRTLLGLAEGAFQSVSRHPLMVEALRHQPITPDFVGTAE